MARIRKTALSFDSGLSKAAQPDSTGRALVSPHILAIAKAYTGAGVFPRPKRCLNSTQLGAADLGSALERARLRVSLALGARKRYRGCPQLAFPVSLAADRARCRRSSRRRLEAKVPVRRTSTHRHVQRHCESTTRNPAYAPQTSVRWISGKERGYSHTVRM